MNASRQSLIVSALICALLAVLFVARWSIAPYAVEAPFEGGMPLASALTRFTVAHGWLAAAVAAIVVGWTLLLVVQLSIKYAPAASRNYLPPQIYLVAAGGVALSGEVLATLLAAWFLVLAMRQFAFSFHKGYSFTELFHAGFWLGLVPLLYAPAVLWILPVAVAALVIYRRSWRETVVCFVGLALPLPAAGFIYWAMGADASYIWQELWRCTIEKPDLEFSLPFTTLSVALPVVALTLTALIRVAGNHKNIRKTQYKFISHVALVSIFMSISAVIPGTSLALAALLGIPCAVCLPYAFFGRGSAVSTAIYSVILVAVLAFHLLPILGISVP